jgi:hypothetical protein
MAADACGISARIVHKWRRNHPWFEARFKQARLLALDRVNGIIFRRAIEEKDLAALALIAKTQIPEFQAVGRCFAARAVADRRLRCVRKARATAAAPVAQGPDRVVVVVR